MTIRQIAIHNFRSIQDARFDVSDFTLLVGANNAGKSTIVDAIRCFYEKDISFKRERDVPRSTLSRDDASDSVESWVEIEYELDDKDFYELDSKYQTENRKLVLRKYFTSGEDVKIGIHALDEDGNTVPELFYGPRNIPEGKLGAVTYIPAVSVVEDVAKLSGPSELQGLVLDILGDVFHKESSELSRNMLDFFEGIKKASGDNQRCSLDRVEEKLNNELRTWGSEMSFSLEPPSIKELVKNQLRFSLKDCWCDTPQDARQFGSGFQRHLIYSILKVRALQNRMPEQMGVRKVFNSGLKVLLFEEPESFLHPDQQELLFRNLKELSKNGFQVICTSHSPKFLSLNFEDVSSLVRVSKVGGVTSVYQIKEREKEDFFNETRNCPLGALPDWQMVAIKYCLLMNPLRAEVMFAERVLLVEGTSETALINALVNKGELEMPFGTVVIDTLGKFNMPRFMFLLQCLGIPHAIIIDRDESREQAGWNAYIEGHKQKLTKHIEYLNPDLERFVGLEKNCGLSDRNKHQKPQKLLWLLDREEIPRLENFRVVVESVMSKLCEVEK